MCGSSWGWEELWVMVHPYLLHIQKCPRKQRFWALFVFSKTVWVICKALREFSLVVVFFPNETLQQLLIHIPWIDPVLWNLRIQILEMAAWKSSECYQLFLQCLWTTSQWENLWGYLYTQQIQFTKTVWGALMGEKEMQARHKTADEVPCECPNAGSRWLSPTTTLWKSSSLCRKRDLWWKAYYLL